MRFHPSAFIFSSVFRSIFTSAASLVVLVSCADNTAPRNVSELDPSASIEITVPDSVKFAYWAELEHAREGGPSNNLMLAPTMMAPGLVASVSSSMAPKPYTKARVAFQPEPAPGNVVPKLSADGLFPNIPIGFDFEFYGAVYDKFNLYMNGFITFGTNIPASASGIPLGFWDAGLIHSLANPNNLIALTWSDWEPNLVPGSIRYETRGTAPNRRFVLQYTDVPEWAGSGRLTAQLVLAEGSNTVTINTMSMHMTRFGTRATQGIENGSGTQATYDSIQSATTGLWNQRVRFNFKLTNDAVTFFPPAPNKAPVVIVPANISVNTDPGSCAAIVEVGSAAFTDDAPGASLMGGVRNDGEPLDALYPKGVTTIAWTSIDVEEAKTTVNQLITVKDAENPSITVPAGISADNDPGKGSAAVVTGSASAEDNCEQVSVAGARSDGAVMSAPFPVGLTTITWTASDASDNSANATQSVVVRDVETPVISLSDISLDATSRSGAVVNFLTPSSDNVGVVRVECTHLAGSMFRVGRTEVTCTAIDAAGNRASDTFAVTVHGAAEQIVALIGLLGTLDLSNGAANPMLNQLQHALDDVEDENGASCKKIDDFIKMLAERKKSLEIQPGDVTDMLADARRIRTVLGCQ